jgi:hypothetical protein
MAYGLKTFKSDGSTVVLQDSSNSAVYGQAYTIGTPTRYLDGAATKDFPEYIGRSIRVFQLRPGPHNWFTGTENGVPYISWFPSANPADYGVTIPEFYYTTTTLYIFVK